MPDLSFQSAMQQTKGKNNAQSLFGLTQIPCNNHIKELMDEVHPSHISPVFKYVFDGLQRSGHLDCFRSYNNNLLFAFDGTQYFCTPICMGSFFSQWVGSFNISEKDTQQCKKLEVFIGCLIAQSVSALFDKNPHYIFQRADRVPTLALMHTAKLQLLKYITAVDEKTSLLQNSK